MKQGYLKFTGDYSKLKSMGYTFQKLYANNYMSWRKSGLLIYKRGAEVTITNYDGYALINFFRTNPKCRRSKQSIFFYKVYDDDSYNDFKYIGMSDEEMDMLKQMRVDDKDDLIVTEYITIETMEALQVLSDLKWFETVEQEFCWEDS